MIIKIDIKYLIFLFLILFIVSCDNTSTSNCKDKCSAVGKFSCDGKNLQVCKKLKNGCLDLEIVKECENSCENNQCIENETCNPACKDNQKCENNSCIDKITKKKTKISLGANQKMNSSNFKLKLNLGKMKTSKDMKSTDYKLKLTSGIK